MLHLTISHLIFLTREQRYALINQETISVIGVNVPVWVNGSKTSEPAVEVFCRYELQNQPTVVQLLQTVDGYLINLPQKKDAEAPPVSDDMWRAMPIEEQEAWYKRYRQNHSASNLRDIKEGGSQFLQFHYISLTKELKIVHNVEIKTMETLIESLN